MAKINKGTISSGGSELSTILGPDANFVGKLTVKRSMRVDGRISGELSSAETITIGTSGSVEGDISAKDIIIGGKVTGKLTVLGKTVLEKTSTLNGDLKTRRLVVEEGAIFNGNSDMDDGKQSAPQQSSGKIKLYDE